MRHVHTVSWQQLCRPKRVGVLGLRSVRNINSASMMKVGWDLTAKREDLWVQVVRSKYKCGRDLMPRVSVDRPGSNLWRGLCAT